MELPLELSVADLPEDIGIAGLVDGERFPAVRTRDLIQGRTPGVIEIICVSIFRNLPLGLDRGGPEAELIIEILRPVVVAISACDVT